MLLETVREFGLDQLRVDGELEAVARAHARYYLQLIEATGALLFARATKAAAVRRGTTQFARRAALAAAPRLSANPSTRRHSYI